MIWGLVVLFLSGGVHAESLKSVLKECTEAAVENDYEYRRLQKEVEIANADLVQSRFEFAPSVSFTSSVDDNDDFTSNSLSASLNLFNGFQDYYSLKAAKKSVAEAEERALVRKRRVEFEAAQRVFAWIDLVLQLQVQEQEVELRNSSFEIMQKRFRRGLVAEDEVLKLQVDRAGSQVRLERLKLRYKAEEESFRRVVGYEISKVKNLQFEVLGFAKYKNLEKLQSQAKTQSPLIRRQILAVERRKDLWRGEVADVYAPSLTGTYSYSNSVFAADPYEYNSEVGLSLTVPLFSQWEDKASADQAKLRWTQAEFQKQQAERDVLVAIAQNHSELMHLKQAYEIQSKAVELAEKFYEQSVKRFRLGIGNSNDMAFDLQRFTRAKTDLSRVQRDLFNAAAEINLNTGEPVIEVF